MIRDKTIAVDSCVNWCLNKLVRAHNAKLGQEPNLTADALGNDVLLQFIKANHPKLLDQWTRFEGINVETDQLLKEGKL